jgi:hypothetical protein
MPVGRDEAVRILSDLHAEVAALFARVSDADLVQRGTIGGGEWSAKDLMAHLSDWEERAIEAFDAWDRHERPAVEDVLEPAGADRANADGVARWLDAPASQIRERFERSHAAVVAAIGARSEEDWLALAGYPRAEPATLAELIGSALGSADGPFRHATAHLPDLRAYAERLPTNA